MTTKYTLYKRYCDEYKSLKEQHTDEDWQRIEENVRVMQNVPTRRRTRALIDVIVGTEQLNLERLRALGSRNVKMRLDVEAELKEKAVLWMWIAIRYLHIPKDLAILVGKKIKDF